MKTIKWLNNKFSSGGVLIAALMGTNFLNFLFNAILGRTLSLEQFSILTLVNTLWFFITVFLNSLASTTNNRAAYLYAKRGKGVAAGFRDFIARRGAYISVGLTLVWLLLIPVFSSIFHTKDYIIFLVLAPSISLGLFTAINRGHFQGTFSFIRAAITIITESVSKLAIAIVFIFLGLKGYAYLAIPLSVLCAFIVSHMFVQLSKRSSNKSDYEYAFPRKLLFATFLTVFSTTAFLSVDLLLARYFLGARESGAYSLLSLVGKMVYFFGGILNVFILTLASRDTGLNKNSAANFYKILAANITLLLIGFLGLGAFGDTFVPFLLGEKSRAILPYLVPYTLGIAMFTASTAFATYHLAKQQYIFAYNGLFTTFLAIVGIAVWHTSIRSFVDVIAISSLVYLAINTLAHVFYKDSSSYVDEEDMRKFADSVKVTTPLLNVSICIPAYNEGKNIANLLRTLVMQESRLVRINRIVVVSSASTDNTDDIVKGFVTQYPQIELIQEQERKGKASAINKFLQTAKDPVVAVQSADTLAEKDAIEKLCRPFLIDQAIGMTGGAPIPLNDPNTFLGFVIKTWWWFHRNIPRFGEIVAFRNILPEVSPRTAVDEAYIQAKFAQLGYKILHVDQARIYNKRAESIKDLITQRRRICIGHTRLQEEENVHISHMTKSSLRLLLFEYKLYGVNQLLWLMGGILIETWANILGTYDKHRNNVNPVAWDVAKSTKDLSNSKVSKALQW